MDAVVHGDPDAVIALTAGTAFDRRSELFLSSVLSSAILRLAEKRRSPFADLQARIRRSLQMYSEHEWSLPMLILVLARVGVHFVKGCAVGAGMWFMEWWLCNRVHRLLVVPPTLPRGSQ